MLSRVIYCTAVVLATTTVILLALFSPLPHRDSHSNSNIKLSFYVQQPQPGTPMVAPSNSGALIYHRWLTEGPSNASRVVGKAQGFIIPVESFAESAFNIIYLTFHDHDEYYGSVSVEARNLAYKQQERLNVVGGTGAFAFARGVAVFGELGKEINNNGEASYHVQMNLEFPNNYKRR